MHNKGAIQRPNTTYLVLSRWRRWTLVRASTWPMGRYLAGPPLYGTESLRSLRCWIFLPPFPLCSSLFFSSSFWSFSFWSYPPFSLSLSFSLTHPLYRFVLSRSLEQRASRSPVGHTPVRVKVSSVLPRIPPPFPLFIKPPPSVTTTFRDTSNDTSCPSSTTAKFFDSSRRVASVLQRDDFFFLWILLFARRGTASPAANFSDCDRLILMIVPCQKM